MEELYKIKHKIKQNKSICFTFDCKNTYIKLEQELLKNNYRWRGHQLNERPDISWNCLKVIFLNYRFGEEKIISYSPVLLLDYIIDIHITSENVQYLINNIFENIPNYNSRKIIRTI